MLTATERRDITAACAALTRALDDAAAGMDRMPAAPLAPVRDRAGAMRAVGAAHLAWARRFTPRNALTGNGAELETMRELVADGRRALEAGDAAGALARVDELGRIRDRLTRG